MKPKQQYKKSKTGSYDLCQTPPYALEPLIRHMKFAKFHRIWEPACGEGLLVDGLKSHGFDVLGTDILERSLESHHYDFFKYKPDWDWQCIVTNPPYSMKYDWIKRCYFLGKPWALLMPVETLGAAAAQFQFDTFGIQVIFMSPRIDFKMPDAGWSGKGAQFPTAWFCWKFDLPKDIMFARLNKVKCE